MNSFLVGLLGLLGVFLAVIRSADHLYSLRRGRRAGRPNLRRPAVLAAATSVSSMLYAHCVGSDVLLLSAALINAGTALMSVLVPTVLAAPMPRPAETPADDIGEGA